VAQNYEAIVDTNLCDQCDKIEDAEHLLDKCSKFNTQRNLPEFQTIKNKKFKEILKENTHEGLNCLIKFITKCDIKI
jgi:hypothetical protein